MRQPLIVNLTLIWRDLAFDLGKISRCNFEIEFSRHRGSLRGRRCRGWCRGVLRQRIRKTHQTKIAPTISSYFGLWLRTNRFRSRITRHSSRKTQSQDKNILQLRRVAQRRMPLRNQRSLGQIPWSWNGNDHHQDWKVGGHFFFRRRRREGSSHTNE